MLSSRALNEHNPFKYFNTFAIVDPTQPNPIHEKLKNLDPTQPNPTQPNPWVNPTHGHSDTSVNVASYLFQFSFIF